MTRTLAPSCRLLQACPTCLTAEGVQVWKIWLGDEEDDMNCLRQLLSPDEDARAARFLFERHRRRFIACRAALRTVLGEYLNELPQRLTFDYGAHGKPELGLAWRDSGLKFNLAHSGDWGLLAVVRGQRVGIDLEQIRPGVAGSDIARRYFAPREVEALQALPVTWQEEAFFRCWTRKEAYLKALGCGIAGGLAGFAVCLAPTEPATLLWVEDDEQAPQRWRMADAQPAEGYLGAVVVETAAGGTGKPPLRELETV